VQPHLVPRIVQRHLPHLPRNRSGAASERSATVGARADQERIHIETCPVSTEGWTRRVHFVREGGGGGRSPWRRGARGNWDAAHLAVGCIDVIPNLSRGDSLGASAGGRAGGGTERGGNLALSAILHYLSLRHFRAGRRTRSRGTSSDVEEKSCMSGSSRSAAAAADVIKSNQIGCHQIRQRVLSFSATGAIVPRHALPVQFAPVAREPPARAVCPNRCGPSTHARRGAHHLSCPISTG